MITHIGARAIKQSRKQLCIVEGCIQKLAGIQKKGIHKGCIHQSAIVEGHCIFLKDIECSKSSLLNNRVRRDEIEKDEFGKHFMMAIRIKLRSYAFKFFARL